MPPKSRKRASAHAAAESADKRARATSAPAAAADEKASQGADAGSLAAFEKWCVDRGFVLHDALELRDVTTLGSTRVSNAAFASKDVRVGDVLVEIPKAWCLTPRTGSVSLAVPEEALEDLDEAALILAVMYERAKGEASAWWPYFSRLPSDHEPIPLLWSEDDKNFLDGTDVAARLKSDAPALRLDHSRIMDVCRAHSTKLPAFFPDGIAPESLTPTLAGDDDDEKDEDGVSSDDSDSDDAPRMEVEDGPFGYRAFLDAASLVASRAFHVDDSVGQGLVPVADMFNHAGGGDEHVHFEGGDEDEDSDSDSDSDSESDDARVEAEMRRLAEDDPSGAASFEAFEALEKEGDVKLASNPATYEDEYTDEDQHGTTVNRESSGRDSLRLVVVKRARNGDELFNTFGDHGNALLLHKYGFAEWTNALSSGGVTISPTQLCDLLGSRDVYFEAFAALEGGFAELSSDDEDEDEEREKDDEKNGDESDKGDAALPWESALDSTDPGAAAARAAGWSGGKYELSASGELSRDLLLLLATALADCDEDDAFFVKTGLPPGLESCDDDALLCKPGVAEAALAAIKFRREALPHGTAEGDLEKARERWALKTGKESAAAPNGVAGVPAAFVLRANERATCEKAAARLVARLRRLTGEDDADEEDDARPASKVTDVVPLQDTPYGAVVYLPKRDSFARTKRKEER